MSVRSSSSIVQHAPGSQKDLLSEVLGEFRLQSATYRSLVLRGDWRLRFDEPLRGVHIVVRGHPHLALDDGSRYDLDPGDLVVLPRADAHPLSSPASSRATVYSSMALARRSPGVETVWGETGEETRIVCGAFFLADDDHPAVQGLPSCIRVPSDLPGAHWLQGMTTALVTEALERGPGSDVVMARLSDALVTRALRHHLQTAEQPGWLHGLRDPALARALTALHADLSRPWTVAALARQAGMARSAFASRFSALVGQSPMDYVTGCRMRHAKVLLRSDRTAEVVAAEVGYGSVAAFSAAFRRFTGMTPGAYRRQVRP